MGCRSNNLAIKSNLATAVSFHHHLLSQSSMAATATATATPIPHIISIQSVMPTKVTPPGQSRRLTLTSPLLPATIQSRLRIVLYYRVSGKEDSARIVAAWIKESLSAALSERPVLAGRLRREGEREGYWELKYNDAGVRLVEAAVETTLEEVLGSEERDEMESQLCYWQDVDAENPNFSALFFIQVTEFRGDGYSIGISCNLLLADPLMFTKFLKEWMMIHNQMLSQGKLSKKPIFHVDYFKKLMQPIQKLNPSDFTTTATNTTMLFKVCGPCGDHTIGYNILITHCIKETLARLDGRMAHEFSLLVSDKNMEVTSYTKDSLSKSDKSFNGTIDLAQWDEFGLEELTLTGEKPIHVSYRIVSSVEKGTVLAMITSSIQEGDSELVVIVTVPKKI